MNIVQILQKSAKLVKTWGCSRLPDGRTLSEALTIGGVSLWDAASSSVALHSVPRALSIAGRPSFWRQIRPFAVRTKHAARERLRPRQSLPNLVERSDQPTLLFLRFNEYMYRDVLEPVVSNLRSCGQVKTIILQESLQSSAQSSPAIGEHVDAVGSYWNREVIDEVKSLRKILRHRTAELMRGSILRDIVADSEDSLWAGMECEFRWLFFAFLPRLVPHVAIARRVLDTYRPALIVSADVADAQSRVYCLSAQQESIPSLDVQFGLYGDEGVEWQFCIADRVAVWGEQSREEMIAQSIPSGKIAITGSPRHDRWSHPDPSDAREVRSSLGLSRNTKVLVFASTYALDAYEGIHSSNGLTAIKTAVLRAAGAFPNIALVVKPHPLENVRELKRLARGFPNVIITDRNLDIRDLVSACDAFITLGSTATFDALMAPRLVIYPTFDPGLWWSSPFLESGAVMTPRTPEALTAVVEQVARGQKDQLLRELETPRRAFLARWTSESDLQSAVRVSILAMNMAGIVKRLTA